MLIKKLFKLAIERGGVQEGAFNNIAFDQDQITSGFETKIVKHINKENEIIKATVTEITKNFIVVDCKAKMEGMIPVEEFKNAMSIAKVNNVEFLGFKPRYFHEKRQDILDFLWQKNKNGGNPHHGHRDRYS